MGEGVLRTGGDLADGKESQQGIDLIRQGYRDPGPGFRQLVAGEPGEIMLADGRRYHRVLPSGFGVILADDALQLREFINHMGGQVCLGQIGGPAGLG